jgi:hypothetical protein
MRLFISLYLMLCGFTFGAYALAAHNINALAVSALVAVVGALFLSTTPVQTK